MTSSAPTHRSRRLTARLILLAVILLIAALRPEVRDWLSGQSTAPPPAASSDSTELSTQPTRLPGESATPEEGPNPASEVSSDSGETGILTEIRPDVFESAAGLVYGPGGREGQRLKHVLLHAEDDLSKPVHGVFDGDRETILRWIDQAYSKGMAGGADVRRREENRRIVLTVHLQGRIGYVGGQKGRRQNHPACEYLRLVLEDDGRTVVTAYPTSSF